MSIKNIVSKKMFEFVLAAGQQSIKFNSTPAPKKAIDFLQKFHFFTPPSKNFSIPAGKIKIDSNVHSSKLGKRIRQLTSIFAITAAIAHMDVNIHTDTPVDCVKKLFPATKATVNHCKIIAVPALDRLATLIDPLMAPNSFRDGIIPFKTEAAWEATKKALHELTSPIMPCTVPIMPCTVSFSNITSGIISGTTTAITAIREAITTDIRAEAAEAIGRATEAEIKAQAMMAVAKAKIAQVMESKAENKIIKNKIELKLLEAQTANDSNHLMQLKAKIFINDENATILKDRISEAKTTLQIIETQNAQNTDNIAQDRYTLELKKTQNAQMEANLIQLQNKKNQIKTTLIERTPPNQMVVATASEANIIKTKSTKKLQETQTAISRWRSSLLNFFMRLPLINRIASNFQKHKFH